MDDRDIFSGKWRGEGEPVWKEPSPEEKREEAKKELKQAMEDGVANMLTEGTWVKFRYEQVELSGKVRGITTMAIPLVGMMPAYIIELDDPSLVPPVEFEGFRFEYNFTCIVVPKLLIDAEENAPK